MSLARKDINYTIGLKKSRFKIDIHRNKVTRLIKTAPKTVGNIF